MSSKTRIRSIAGVVILCVFSLSSCAWRRPIAFSPSSSPLSPDERGVIPAYGEDCHVSILGMIPISGLASIQNALEEAKNSAVADALTELVVEEELIHYVAYSRYCVMVQGLGVRH